MRRLRRSIRLELRRVRERAPAAVARAARLGSAAVASYLVATRIVSDPRPVTAALTALLIVQVTLVGTVADTLRRILSVVVGVAVAIGVSALLDFTWWSMALLVVGSILLGQVLRLGPHLLEVPISAMLILAAGGAGIAALDRVNETLIGACVGLLVNVVFPPAIRTRSAGVAIQQFAASLARLLDRVAEALADRAVETDEAREWLDEARRITDQIDRVDQILAEAGESRRLNPRAFGTADTTPDLRSGLDALEHSAVALRAVFRSIADGAFPTSGRPGGEAEEDPEDAIDDDLRQAFAVLMSDLARAVTAFGALIRAEIDEADEPHSAELAEALDAVQEARVRLTELLLVDPREAPGQWELRGSLLAGVERVLAELDVEQRRRRREQRRLEAAAARGAAAVAAQRLRTTTRRVVTEAAPPVRRRRRRL